MPRRLPFRATEVLFLAPDNVIGLESGFEATFGRDARGKVSQLELFGMKLKKVK